MATSVPGALNAFISITQAALPTGTLVRWGKPIGKYVAPVTLEIYNVKGNQEVAELGPTYRREEHYSLECLITTWAGNDDPIGRMADATGAWSTVEIAVANNPTLNQSIRFAQVTSFDLDPTADPRGPAMCKLTFAVYCEARVNSLT